MASSADSGFNTFLMSTGALTLMCLTVTWYGTVKKKLEKKDPLDRVLSSPETSWKKVATVADLLCYPMKSGKAQFVKECYFSEYGIVNDDGVCSIEDRMFIVYQEGTGISLNACLDVLHKKLLIVKLRFASKNRAKLEVKNMPSLEFNLPDVKSKPVTIRFFQSEKVDGIDCGPEPAKWLSQYLYGKDSGARLALRIPNNRRKITSGPWISYAQAYSTMRNEDSVSDVICDEILNNKKTFLRSRIEKFGRL